MALLRRDRITPPALLLAFILGLAAANARAECEDTSVGAEPVIVEAANKDGTSLALKTIRCETEVSLNSGKTSRVLLKLPGGSANSKFVDLNGDGIHEIDIVFGCGVVNCRHAIFALEGSAYRPRRVLRFLGEIERIQDYFFVSSRQGAAEYWAEGYRISDLARLDVEQKPSIFVCNCADKRTDEQVCRLPRAQVDPKSPLAAQIVEKFCFPDTKVQYDYSVALEAIAKDIEALKPGFPQLREFSASKQPAGTPLAIRYGFHTHAPPRTGGWMSGVPHPDDDGVWFFVDVHDSDSTLQVHTQPMVVAPMCLGSARVSFLIIEGKDTKTLNGPIWTILRNHGAREC